MRIAIVDCDHESFTEEEAVCQKLGIELERFTSRTPAEVIEAARGAEAILVQYAPITAEVLDALPQLKAVGRYGVGVDTVDVPAATARGVAVCNVVDYGTEDVSTHAIALTMAVVRATSLLDRRVRAGQYELAAATPLHRISAQRFGVVGLGRIGRATAAKARALGFAVHGYDPMLEIGTTTDEGIEVASLENVLSGSDVLSLHLPLTETTRHLIDAAALASMRPGAYLVNTSRGGLVDTVAVLEALRSGQLGGAGLDVFETEPLPAEHPLTTVPTAVLTPHASWYSEESYSELKTRVTEAVAAVIGGERPRDIFNPEVLQG